MSIAMVRQSRTLLLASQCSLARNRIVLSIYYTNWWYGVDIDTQNYTITGQTCLSFPG